MILIKRLKIEAVNIFLTGHQAMLAIPIDPTTARKQKRQMDPIRIDLGQSRANPRDKRPVKTTNQISRSGEEALQIYLSLNKKNLPPNTAAQSLNN